MQPEDGGDNVLRGLFIGLMIIGAIWTGGLVWSMFGSLVLVPSSAITLGAPRTAPLSPQNPTQQLTQTKPSTTAPAKPAQMLDGRFDLQSAPGRSTTITLDVPLVS